jgi:hypothetical protein
MGAFSFAGPAASAAASGVRGPKRLPATSHVFYDQVVTFKKGSSELSKADQDTLAALFQTIKSRSQKVEQVHLAAWSDRPFSPKAPQTKKDRALAESRIVALETVLEGPLAMNYVATYNMAERSNWFARGLVAKPRDVKTLFSQRGAPQNVTPEDFAVVREKGGPSKAVLLIELESSAAAN